MIENEDGELIRGCPYQQIDPGVSLALAYYTDWQAGHSPVTNGRVSWLPLRFIETMHYIRGCISRQESEKLSEQRATVGVRTRG